MKYLLVGLLSIFTSLTALAQNADARLSGIDSLIDNLLKEWKVPGLSVAIVEKNKPLLVKGYGYRDMENRKPVTGHTIFSIGSCTKAFTAAMLSVAIESNKLDLDQPIQEYLPELRFYNSELTAAISLRDMLTHRTGLPRHDYAWYSGFATTRDSLLRVIRYLEPSAPLRQTFQYNNYMYAAIGSLLEKINNRSWEEQLNQQLFLPLNMQHSFVGSQSAKADFSYGYMIKDGQIKRLDFMPPALWGMAPAGGINSCASDMANWLLMWTNQGLFQGKEILSRSFYQQAISSQMVVNANLPSVYLPDYFFFNYGLGWYISNYRGHYGVGHGGNVNGFSSFVSFLPTDSIGLFISANQNNSPLPRIVHNLILDRLIAASPRNWNDMLKQTMPTAGKAEADMPDSAAASHAMTSFAGVYRSKAYGTITIQHRDNELYGTFNRWKLTIKHLRHNYFRFSIDADVFDGSEAVEAEFRISPAGQIAKLQLQLEPAVKAIEFVKEEATVAQSVDAGIYTGNYQMAGKMVRVFLKNGTLVAQVSGQPEYILVSSSPHTFEVKAVKGYTVLFHQDPQGLITGFTMQQPGGAVHATRMR